MERETCTVNSNRADQYEGVKAGLYVRVPSSDVSKMVVYKDPFVLASKLSLPVLQNMMKEIKPPSEWFETVLLLNSSDGSIALEPEDIERCKDKVKRMRDACSPGPKRK